MKNKTGKVHKHRKMVYNMKQDYSYSAGQSICSASAEQI